MELEIVLDYAGSMPLYEQIYRDIRDRIRRGELAPGERLPATRVMSQNLHVARSTAVLAYEQLESEGYIEQRPGSGAYVCDIEHLTEFTDMTGNSQAQDAESRAPLSGMSPDNADLLAPALSAVGAQRHRHMAGDRTGSAPVPLTAGAGRRMDTPGAAESHLPGRESESSSAVPDPLFQRDRPAGVPEQHMQDRSCVTSEHLIDFSPRAIDMSVFPYATWRRIMRGILTGDRADLFSRGDPQGDSALRTTIARYLHLARGCHCTPEQIVIGAGNDYLMMLLAMILGEGRRIGMESPTYLRAAGIAAAMHDEVVPIRSDSSGMDISALTQASCTLVYCMPTRQYPTGIAMPWPRRAQLLRWAAAAPDRFIIEDDYDSEFKYRGRPVPSLQSQDANDRVIYMGTFSKSIAPAIRVSYLILPPPLMDVFRERAGILSCTVPRMDQAILDEFIRDGYFERHLNRMRSRYRAKHDLMLEVMSPVSEQFAITGSGAGLHLVLESRNPGRPLSGETMRERNLRIEETLVQSAAASGVHVYPMSEAYLDAPLPEGQHTPPAILLGYAALTEEEIRRGGEQLIQTWI